MPGFDDWGIDGNGYRRVPNYYGSYTNFLRQDMTDMYYCIGSVSVTNTTEGWDIAADNTYSFDLSFNVYLIDHYKDTCKCIGRTFYTTDTVDRANQVHLKPSMQSNNWGPIPFIIMAPEKYVPKNPEGVFFNAMLENSISLGEEDIQLGVIDKNGEYHDLVDSSEEE